MTWYHAANGQQAGPFTDEQFQQLVANGTIQPATLVWEARLPNWVPLSQVPPEMLTTAPTAGTESAAPAALGGVVCSECQQTFAPDQVIVIAGRPVCGACKPILVQRLSEGAATGAIPGVSVSEQQVLDRDYQIEIGTALERAWKTFTSHVGPVIVSSLLMLLLLAIVAGVVGAVGVLGFQGIRAGGGMSAGVIAGVILFAFFVMLLLLAFVIVNAGYGWFYLNLHRHGDTSYGNIFAGFRRGLGSLLGAWFIQILISIGVSVPFSVASQVILHSGLPPAASMGINAILQLISTAIGIYLSVLWIFTNFLIMDKGMGAWAAMKLSRKVIAKRWWMSFLFLIVAGIIASVGFLACGVGLLVSMPLCLLMIVALYDDNFRDLEPAQS